MSARSMVLVGIVVGSWLTVFLIHTVIALYR